MQKIEWETIKQDCKYDESDNNDGLIYGVEISEDGNILDYVWFEAEKERNDFLTN